MAIHDAAGIMASGLIITLKKEESSEFIEKNKLVFITGNRSVSKFRKNKKEMPIGISIADCVPESEVIQVKMFGVTKIKITPDSYSLFQSACDSHNSIMDFGIDCSTNLKLKKEDGYSIEFSNQLTYGRILSVMKDENDEPFAWLYHQ